MSSYAELYDEALLAHAAYLDFPELAIPGGAMSEDELLERLLGPDRHETIRFTAVQADYIKDNFEVMAYRSVGGLSGFQAVVFRHTTTGRLTLAIRGTEEASDFLANFNLEVLGLAINQTDDLDQFIADLGDPALFNLLSPSVSIDIAGHSLGGHLSHYANTRSGLSVNGVFAFNGASTRL